MKDTHTPPRSVRVPDELWEKAKAEAERRGETVTDAIVRYLTRYTRP
jgi:macrodomain Ter protein organizer (MatP/YcbG family)